MSILSRKKKISNSSRPVKTSKLIKIFFYLFIIIYLLNLNEKKRIKVAFILKSFFRFTYKRRFFISKLTVLPMEPCPALVHSSQY